jgi:hypothetical protein
MIGAHDHVNCKSSAKSRGGMLASVELVLNIRM